MPGEGSVPQAGAPGGETPKLTTEVAYDASAIQVLEGLEAVRKRPGMYIGSTGERGLHHLIWEIVDNAVDESLAGHCDTILITFNADGSVSVEDNGRGIPTDTAPGQEIPAATLALTVLHAGGKFGGGGYKVSGGLHGVGSSVVNALSTHLHMEIKNRGHLWEQEFTKGVPDYDLREVRTLEDGERTGTTITWWASPEIFETTEYNLETVSARFREMAFLNKGLKIILRDARPKAEQVLEAVEDGTSELSPTTQAAFNSGEIHAVEGHDHKVLEQVFQFERGLADYVDFLNLRKQPISPIIDFEAETGPDAPNSMSLEVAMQWQATSYNESVHTFANNINTPEGGTHEEGFRAALTSLVNRWGEEWGLIKKKEDRLTGDDIREGLTAIISLKISEPQFEGQTKAKLGNTEAKGFVQSVVNDQLGAWLEQNPSDGKEIIRKAQAAATARLAARKARDLARNRKGLLGGGGLPGKLRDCSSRSPEECEVFIVEGDSAGGSAVMGRDNRIQAILPIRGKILNVEKARIDKVLANQEVQAIVSALGTGVQDEFDADKLRYHKIVLMADADVDGHHINTLLLTLLFRFMRPLIEAGYVYLAQPPLYRIKWNKPHAHEYVYSDAERDAVIRDGIEQGKKLPKDASIQRYKGLGEMNADELWDTTLDPDQRVLLQVTLEDAAQADEIFSVLMGEDVEQRRSFIQRNAKDVRFLDI
ncbi:DNA topoisomerase (ATP-hydrolyzing) subunit B [Nocardioides sp. zg-536]|uniref:DNA gyrase subunit B n=1 Tax=Nocardioides faecalis TaxID=2803858 RepID=A0A939BVV1_9ACTN|nr:DNA topoisomerase (ATP-hydrolyzing) subunit B [Nocardioides faecalis]MBM9459927.1 DNA topoisomerase (ATP-hydrolyzing) subunit B [Nocardioides faecalis]MBS4753203.1 DNA topoisomerase (ATP-hydrolyzing) subunit B [Nocardioides faecalis]QVI60375.1 DNA topoisomerase (ATP-hydrolyzing) subunit B [Nocardioides faecalis]